MGVWGFMGFSPFAKERAVPSRGGGGDELQDAELLRRRSQLQIRLL